MGFLCFFVVFWQTVFPKVLYEFFWILAQGALAALGPRNCALVGVRVVQKASFEVFLSKESWWIDS